MTSPESQQPNSKQDSGEKVHFLESVAYKYMSGERVSTGIRVDSGLYKRFKQVTKHVYGSTCRAIELYMIAVIETTENGVHFSNTVNQPIQIEKIVIERNLRPRRSLPVQEFEETITEVKTAKKTERKLIVRDVPDYSSYSLERLEQLHRMYQNRGDVGKSAFICAELKKRGQEVS